jgi:Pyridoxamine 5'-phosphate oxidase
MGELRSVQERRADVLAALGRQGDLWLATSDRKGRPHLIAVSAWWNGSQVIMATAAGTRSARNLEATRVARLAIGSPADAIVIDADVAGGAKPVASEPQTSEGFATAVGWDPRKVDGDWVYFTLLPSRIQAYRGFDEQPGREVMRAGRWLI